MALVSSSYSLESIKDLTEKFNNIVSEMKNTKNYHFKDYEEITYDIVHPVVFGHAPFVLEVKYRHQIDNSLLMEVSYDPADPGNLQLRWSAHIELTREDPDSKWIKLNETFGSFLRDVANLRFSRKARTRHRLEDFYPTKIPIMLFAKKPDKLIENDKNAWKLFGTKNILKNQDLSSTTKRDYFTLEFLFRKNDTDDDFIYMIDTYRKKMEATEAVLKLQIENEETELEKAKLKLKKMQKKMETSRDRVRTETDEKYIKQLKAARTHVQNLVRIHALKATDQAVDVGRRIDDAKTEFETLGTMLVEYDEKLKDIGVYATKLEDNLDEFHDKLDAYTPFLAEVKKRLDVDTNLIQKYRELVGGYRDLWDVHREIGRRKSEVEKLTKDSTEKTKYIEDLERETRELTREKLDKSMAYINVAEKMSDDVKKIVLHMQGVFDQDHPSHAALAGIDAARTMSDDDIITVRDTMSALAENIENIVAGVKYMQNEKGKLDNVEEQLTVAQERLDKVSKFPEITAQLIQILAEVHVLMESDTSSHKTKNRLEEFLGELKRIRLELNQKAIEDDYADVGGLPVSQLLSEVSSIIEYLKESVSLFPKAKTKKPGPGLIRDMSIIVNKEDSLFDEEQKLLDMTFANVLDNSIEYWLDELFAIEEKYDDYLDVLKRDEDSMIVDLTGVLHYGEGLLEILRGENKLSYSSPREAMVAYDEETITLVSPGYFSRDETDDKRRLPHEQTDHKVFSSDSLDFDDDALTDRTYLEFIVDNPNNLSRPVNSNSIYDMLMAKIRRNRIFRYSMYRGFVSHDLIFGTNIPEPPKESLGRRFANFWQERFKDDGTDGTDGTEGSGSGQGYDTIETDTETGAPGGAGPAPRPLPAGIDIGEEDEIHGID